MTVTTGMRLSLADVARLADVQRPVVSMWRRRELADAPFPRPVAVVDGEERFDATEVAAYLARTGRGNNPEAREDAAAHVHLASLSRLDLSVAADGLTALLCLAAVTDELVGSLSPRDLLRLAYAADPEDLLLLREIRALGDDLPALAAYADAVADAAYSTPAAFEGVLRRHRQRALTGHAATALQPGAADLVARTARALAADAGMDAPTFVDVTEGSGDVLLALAGLYAEGAAPTFATLPLDTPASRLLRRRLRVHDLHRVDAAVVDGDLTIPGASGPLVHVVQLPSVTRPSMSDLEVLEVADELALGLGEHDRAVLVGPASALADAPTAEETDLVRDGILRADRLRAVARLPRGLVVRSPRRALALWAFGPTERGVPRAERTLALADLTDTPLTPAAVGDLVTDLVAASRSSLTDRHRYAYARRVPTSTLLPGRRPLVDRPVGRRITHHAGVGGTVDALVHALGDTPLAGLRVEARPEEPPPSRGPATLGEAAALRLCRVIAGNRVDDAHVDTGGDGRVVIGPAEVRGEAPVGGRRIGLLTFAAAYASGRVTEPGDVVFCTGPRPVAIVDHVGGSVVAAPARVLRVSDDGLDTLVPEVLAADITRIGRDRAAPDWRRWPVRPVPAAQRETLRRALHDIEHEQAAARERLTRLETLANALRDGVTSGALTLIPPPPPARDPRPEESTDVSASDTPYEEGR